MKKYKIFAGLAIASLALMLVSSVTLAKENGNNGNNGNNKKIEKDINNYQKKLTTLENQQDHEEGDLKSMGFGSGTGQQSGTLKPDGSFKVTGVLVNSVNASTSVISVSYFGFVRDVNFSGAKLYGGGKQITVADIKVGDILFGQGTFNKDTKTITVERATDQTLRKRNGVESIQSKIKDLEDLINKLKQSLTN